MLDFYTASMPKARKKHKCDLCGQTIEKGQQYSYFTGKYDGEFFTTRHCLPCSEIIDAYCDRIGEQEYDEDGVQDWLRDTYCDYCEHGSRNEDDCEEVEFCCPHIRQHYEK